MLRYELITEAPNLHVNLNWKNLEEIQWPNHKKEIRLFYDRRISNWQ